MQEHSTGVIMSIQKLRWHSAMMKSDSLTFKAWVEDLKEKHGKTAVIPGMEPTGALLVQPWKVPAGQWNETGSCKSKII